MKFLATDTETGGLKSAEHSLLTLHMRVLDESLNRVDQLDIAIKHNVYRVTAGALRINKIDLVRHDQMAVTISVAQQMMDNFLMTHGAQEKLIFMAHNVPFDKGFIGATFNMEVFEKFCDYHSLDTVTLGVIEKWLGTMSKRQSLSLEKIAETLNLEKGEAHTASGDVTTMENYAKDFITRYAAKIRGSL